MLELEILVEQPLGCCEMILRSVGQEDIISILLQNRLAILVDLVERHPNLHSDTVQTVLPNTLHMHRSTNPKTYQFHLTKNQQSLGSNGWGGCHWRQLCGATHTGGSPTRTLNLNSGHCRLCRGVVCQRCGRPACLTAAADLFVLCSARP